jgi:lysophospholipase L1-like esterase
MPAPVRSRAPSRGGPRRILRGVLEWTLVGVVTLAVCELALRLVLDIQPLTTEALVWQHHPRWGWSHRPGSEDLFVKPGCRQQVRINSLGLREREIGHEKTPGVFRILALGDSFVAGFEVAAEDVFTRAAERWLNEHGARVEFVNAGHRGWGTDQSLLFLGDEGVRYAPDLVLYQWTENDRDDIATVHRPFRRFGKGWFDLDPAGGLVLRGVPVPEFPYDHNLRVGEDGEVHELPVSRGVRAQMWIRDHTVVRSSTATALVLIASALPQLRAGLGRAGSYGDFRDAAFALDRGTRLFRVTAALVTEMRRVSREAGAEFRMLGPQGGWAAALKDAAGLPDLGEHARYRASIPEGARTQIPLDPHMNALGHRLYGEALARALVEDGLVPTPPPGASAAAGER